MFNIFFPFLDQLYLEVLFFFGHVTVHGILVPNQGLNPCPLHWRCLNRWTSGKHLNFLFFNFNFHLKFKLQTCPKLTTSSRNVYFLHANAKSLQSWPTLCDPTDGSPSGSTIAGILQARILEWVAISFSINRH